MPRDLRTSTTLHIKGDGLVPEWISALLGAQPSNCFRKGDERVVGGRVVGMQRFGLWSLRAADRQDGQVDKQISGILDQLNPALSAWSELAEDHEAYLSVGVFLHGGNDGLLIAAPVVAALGARGIGLDLDIYAPSDAVDPAVPLQGPRRMTADEFLALDREHPGCCEYVDGITYPLAEQRPAAMSDDHEIIRLNTAASLSAALPDSLLVFAGGVKLGTSRAGSESFRRPDVIVCACSAHRQPGCCSGPILIADVLTRHSERPIRFEAQHSYREIGTLGEYLLILERAPVVEVYRRSAGWQMQQYGIADTIELESVGRSIRVSQLYRRIRH